MMYTVVTVDHRYLEDVGLDAAIRVDCVDAEDPSSAVQAAESLILGDAVGPLSEEDKDEILLGLDVILIFAGWHDDLREPFIEEEEREAEIDLPPHTMN